MREVKTVGDDRMRRVLSDFLRSGLMRATVNKTKEFDPEPVSAWRGLKPLVERMGLDVDVKVEGDNVVLMRRYAL